MVNVRNSEIGGVISQRLSVLDRKGGVCLFKQQIREVGVKLKTKRVLVSFKNTTREVSAIHP